MVAKRSAIPGEPRILGTGPSGATTAAPVVKGTEMVSVAASPVEASTSGGTEVIPSTTSDYAVAPGGTVSGSKWTAIVVSGRSAGGEAEVVDTRSPVMSLTDLCWTSSPLSLSSILRRRFWPLMAISSSVSFPACGGRSSGGSVGVVMVPSPSMTV